MKKINYPKASIMVITYNHEKYIGKALESVLTQETEYDFEVNVIEDCSTDKTQAVILEYKKLFPGKVNLYFNLVCWVFSTIFCQWV